MRVNKLIGVSRKKRTDEKQWSGADFMLAEEGGLRKRLSSLYLLLWKRSYSAAAGGPGCRGETRGSDNGFMILGILLHIEMNVSKRTELYHHE